jgi:hypothetical protein
LDIQGNDVDISIETVETLEEIETNSDGSGSCADKNTQQDRSFQGQASAVTSQLW